MRAGVYGYIGEGDVNIEGRVIYIASAPLIHESPYRDTPPPLYRQMRLQCPKSRHLSWLSPHLSTANAVLVGANVRNYEILLAGPHMRIRCTKPLTIAASTVYAG